MNIIVKNNNTIKAYRILKRKLQEDGWHKDIAKSSYYVSKSKKTRSAKNIAILREKKRQKESEELFIKQEASALKNRKKKFAKR